MFRKNKHFVRFIDTIWVDISAVAIHFMVKNMQDISEFYSLLISKMWDVDIAYTCTTEQGKYLFSISNTCR